MTEALLWKTVAQINLMLGWAATDFWREAWHYLSPAIFGKDYQCGLLDVGTALKNLPGKASTHLTEARLDRTSSVASQLSQELCGFEGEHCYPDLQLLALVDLIGLGIDPNQIILHRVNTFESRFYPSYRRDERKKDVADPNKKRLVTLIEWKNQ
jgi:hypothetical protein